MMKNYITLQKESLRLKVSFILMTFLMVFCSINAQAQEDDYSQVSVTVSDTQAPTVTAPNDISIDGCDRNDIANTYPLWGYSTSPVSLSLAEYEGLSGASATDNGNIASISYTDATDNGSCTEVVTRTFTVTDNCDNFTTATQIITIADVTAPTISCISDRDVIVPQTETQYTVSGTEFDISSITDNCSSAFAITNNLNGTSTLDGYSLPLGVTSVTWTVEDDCGNISTCTYELNVIAPDIVATLTAIDIDGNPMPVNYESVGQVINYEITFVNNGTYGINVITVTDPNADPGSITYVSGDDTNIGTLDPGETWVYTETRTVTQQNIDDGQVANTATVHGYIDENGNNTYEVGETPTSNDTEEIIVEALQNPQVAFTKTQTTVNYNSAEADGNSVSPVKQLGDVINYDIIIENTGNITITNVNLSDSFPGAGSGTLSAKTETGGTGVNGNDILEVGETWSYTASYTVTQADIDANIPLINTAELETFQIPGPSYATENTPVDGSIILSVDKTQVSITNPDSSPAGTFVDEPGDRITYNITLTNDGSRTLTNVTPTETFPGTTGIGTLSTASESMNANGNLEVGENWTYTATYTVSQEDIDNNSSLTNTISVLADELSTAEVATATTSVSRNPAWTISKAQNPTNQTYTAPGDVLTYGITLENTGNISISNINVTDVTADASPGVVKQTDLVGNNDNIMEPGESWYYTAQYTVTQTDIDSGTYTNTASATGDPVGGGMFGGVEDQESIDASQTLSIGDVTVTEGENVDFLISLTGISSTDISFTPQLSNGTATIGTDTGTPLQYSSDDGSTWTNYSSGNIIIPSGITSMLVRIPTIDDALTEAQENFTFAANVTSSNTANSFISATGTINDNDAITISLEGFEITETGDPQTGYFVARIDGGALAQENIILSFNTIDGSALDGQDYTAQSNTSYTIASGSSQVNIPVEILGDEIIENQETFLGTMSIANANGQDVGITGTNGEATSTINDDDIAAMELTKTDSLADTDSSGDDSEGDIITYTITVRNTGNVTLANIEITDNGVTFTGSNTIASLAPGATASVTANYTLTQADIDAGSYSNQASATGDSPGKTDDVSDDLSDDPDTPALNDPTVTTITQSPTLTIVNTVAPTDIAAPQTLTYTIVVDNTGNTSLTNVAVVDPQATTGPAYVSGDSNSNDIMEVDETWTYTATYEATQADIDNGSDIVHTASVTTTEVTTAVTDDATTTITQSPSLTVANIVAPTDIAAPQTLTYTIVVDNTGNTSLTNVAVVDPQATTGPAYVSGDSNSNDIMEVDETWTYTATYEATQADIDNGSDIVHTASVTTTEVTTAVTDDATTTITQSPTLTVTNTVAPTDIAAPQTLTYTIVVDNTGNTSLTNVAVVDPQATTGPAYVSGDSNSNDIMEVDETWTYTATYEA
ncbi:beta strand repeat-containing protein, partial [Christiangramia sabulilitoris]